MRRSMSMQLRANALHGVTPPQCFGEGPGVGFDFVSVIINLYLIFVYRKREW